MKKKQIDQLVLGIILLLPALFLSGFAIHDALMPTMSCKQACSDLQSEYVGCDDDFCMCQPEGSSTAMHIERLTDDNRTYIVECSE